MENYDNNVDGQKTLLLDACNNDKFFSGMTDEMVLAYADVCRKLNDRFDLNVKKVYPIEKITADLSLFEKIKKAIGYSDILGEILEEVGDINALVVQMVKVSAFDWAGGDGLRIRGGGAGSCAVRSRGFILGDRASCRDCRACKILHGSI